MVKKPEERRIELLKTAQELFFSQGYEQTSVQNIIDAVGIAKGTFYHYFQSKEDLLNQLASWMAEELFKELQQKIEQMNGNALEKFRLLVSSALNWKFGKRRDLSMTYIRVMYQDKNLAFRQKAIESWLEKLRPFFIKVINQGVKEGIFNVADPEESVDNILSMGIGLGERLLPVILSLDEHPENFPIFVKKAKGYENAIERILGAEEGILKIYDVDALREVFVGEKNEQ